MKNIIILTSIIFLVSFRGQAKPSYKVYKDSVVDNNLYLVLDMEYFGQSIQKEECERLKKFYNEVNPQRKFYCRKTKDKSNPIKK